MNTLIQHCAQSSIDPLNDDLIPLAVAAKERPLRHPRTGRPASVGKMFRIVLHGAMAANGSRIRLEAVRTPSGLVTTREAIARFIHQLTNPTTAVPTPAKRRRQQEQAERELTEAGFEIGGAPDPAPALALT